MLIRFDGDLAVLIAQPAHAALSGQLARAWGSPRFGHVTPFDDVCLGAQLHDIGWIDWEQSPTLNPTTGLPHTFMQLPTRVHLDIWGTASQRALAFGRYPALLTSMHFTGLYERFHDYARDSAEDARAARELVARELAFQQRTIEALSSDPATASSANEEQRQRNRDLIALWDGMSLAICHGLSESRTFRNVPGRQERIDVVLAPVVSGISVDPWPFTVDSLTVHADARVLSGTYGSQPALDGALTGSQWTTVSTRLVPARSSTR